jgi:predicted ATPase
MTSSLKRENHMRRFIVTGAPGAAKTAIIRQLELDGFSVVEEAATDAIAALQAQGTVQPWGHPAFIDVIASCKRTVRLGRLINQMRFSFTTVASPPGAPFFTFLPAKQISFEETVRFEKTHEETYRDSGFELVSVEPRSLVERVSIIKAAVR